MKNAKIVVKTPTLANLKLAAALVCAAKFAKVKKPVKRAAASATADVMASVVTEATKPAKVENYSAAVTVDLLAQWADSDKSKAAVEKLAGIFGKTTRSLVAKLAKEKVYVKAEYVTKAGTKPVSKEQHVIAIAAFMGVDAAKLESLEKANKCVLQMLEDAMKKSAQSFADREAEIEAENEAAFLESENDETQA